MSWVSLISSSPAQRMGPLMREFQVRCILFCCIAMSIFLTSSVSAEETRTRGSCALFLAHDLGIPGRVRGLDAVAESFRTTHARAGSNKPPYLDHPEFEGFTVLQEVRADGASSIK
jgi:hypothetical protein